MLDTVVPLLARLVAFDTQNPPRAIDGGGLFRFCIDELGPEFRCELVDLGDGCVSLFAVRGEPSILFNVHVDTVPADPGWTHDPHTLRVEGDRVVGLGACDIKGAAACLLAVAKVTRGPLALLFSSDEEAGTSRCIRAFLATGRRFRGVVVSEPTACRAVLEHRGIVTASASFTGTGGHGSAPRAFVDSAVHEGVRWSARALAFAEEAESTARYGALQGIRLNLGTFRGGTKSNMIAAEAAISWNFRPLPSQRPEALLAELAALAPHPERARFEPSFIAPPLPTGGAPAAREAESFARELGMDVAPAVDFWTEAALFSEAGMPTLVYGPGHIAEAHTAGEWVLLAELAEAAERFRALSR